MIRGCMRVILRDLKTGLYFSRGKVWVGNLEEAVEFATLEEAGLGPGRALERMWRLF